MEFKKQFKWFTIFEYEKEQDYVGYSYFRKAVAENTAAEEIFCDEESKFQMMQRVLKGRMVPLLVIFFVLLLPQFFHLLSTHNYFVATFTGGVLALYLGIFTMCFVKYSQYKSDRK